MREEGTDLYISMLRGPSVKVPRGRGSVPDGHIRKEYVSLLLAGERSPVPSQEGDPKNNVLK